MYVEFSRHVSSWLPCKPLIYRPFNIPIDPDMSVQVSKSGLRQTGVFGCRSETNWRIRTKGLANMSSDDP